MNPTSNPACVASCTLIWPGPEHKPSSINTSQQHPDSTHGPLGVTIPRSTALLALGGARQQRHRARNNRHAIPSPSCLTPPANGWPTRQFVTLKMTSPMRSTRISRSPSTPRLRHSHRLCDTRHRRDVTKKAFSGYRPQAASAAQWPNCKIHWLSSSMAAAVTPAASPVACISTVTGRTGLGVGTYTGGVVISGSVHSFRQSDRRGRHYGGGKLHAHHRDRHRRRRRA